MAKLKLEIEFKAQPGDLVSVLNYRKRPSQWVTGTVTHVKSSLWHPDLEHSTPYHNAYTVRVDGGNHNSYEIHVGDSSISEL